MKNINSLKKESDIQLKALELNRMTQWTLVAVCFVLAGLFSPLFAILCLYFFARSLSTSKKIKNLKENELTVKNK